MSAENQKSIPRPTAAKVIVQNQPEKLAEITSAQRKKAMINSGTFFSSVQFKPGTTEKQMEEHFRAADELGRGLGNLAIRLGIIK